MYIYVIAKQTTANIFSYVYRNTKFIQGVSPSDMFDYEKAAMNAAEALFMGLERKGCFYHLASNIWKKYSTMGSRHSITQINNSLSNSG